MFRVVGFVQLRSAELCAVIEANAKLAVEQSVNPAVLFSISTCVEYQTSDERSWRISSCLKAPLKQQCQAGTEEPFSLRKLAGSNKKSEEKKLNVGSQTSPDSESSSGSK